MKLRVNLYVQALQPVKEKISLNMLAGSALGLSAVLLVAGLLINLRADSIKTELAMMQKQVKAQEQQVSQLQQQLGKREPSPALVKQHAALLQVIAQKQKLLQFVQGEQRKTSVKYSPVFQYLAQIDPQGFWLDGFSLNASSSQFSGYVTQAALLPQWMTKLSDTAFFKGHTFSQFEMKQQKDSEVLSFRVTSSAADGSAEETKP